MFDIKNNVLAAEKRIRSHIRETPLDYSAAISRENSSQCISKM
jgi:threonine dehydratase